MKISLNFVLIKAFCIAVLFRIFADLPLSFYNVGWLSNPPTFPYTRFFSFLLLMLCFMIISAKAYSGTRLGSKTVLNICIVLGFLLFTAALGLITYEKVGMSKYGLITVFFRYLIELLIVISLSLLIKSQKGFNLIWKYLFRPAIHITIGILFFQVITSSYHEIQGIYRLPGPFSNPNVCASFLNVFILASILFFQNNKKGWVVINIIALEFFLVMTGSLTSILVNIVFFIFLFFHRRLYRTKVFYTMAPILFLGVVYLTYSYWESITYRISKVFDLEQLSLSSASSIGWRFEAWEAYLGQSNTVFESIFGLGLGFQRFIFLTGYKGNLSHIFEAPGTHNDYLAIFLDFGILGLAIFLYLILICFSKLKMAAKFIPKAIIVRYFLYCFLIAMFMDNYIDGMVTMTFLIILISIISLSSEYHKAGKKIEENKIV